MSIIIQNTYLSIYVEAMKIEFFSIAKEKGKKEEFDLKIKTLLYLIAKYLLT